MIELINQSEVRMPQAFLKKTHKLILKKLKLKKIKNKNLLQNPVTLVFLDPKPAKKINQEFRQKNYATDVLSFAGEDGSLGELIMCPQVLQKQAKEHKLTFQQELTYMLIHGMLHLLGYDHELSQKHEKEMFALQDEIFESLKHVHSL